MKDFRVKRIDECYAVSVRVYTPLLAFAFRFCDFWTSATPTI